MAGVLIIAGRTISVASWLDFDQSVEVISGSILHRMANGAGMPIDGWRKHKITLSGSGWTPAALIGINYSAAIEVTLPTPFAFAVGEPLPAGWTLVSETTGPDVTGADVRLVLVRLTAFTTGPRLSNNNASNPGWELVLEEM